MAKIKVTRLINRIAEEVHDEREAQAVIALLSQVKDWNREIKSSNSRRKKREKSRVNSANKRARDNGLPDYLTYEEWFETLEYFQWKCAYCQKDFSYDDLDHFIPIANNTEGTTAWNCVPACKDCNLYKRDRNIDHWLAQLSLDEDEFESPFVKSLKRVRAYLVTRRKEAYKPKESLTQFSLLEARSKYHPAE